MIPAPSPPAPRPASASGPAPGPCPPGAGPPPGPGLPPGPGPPPGPSPPPGHGPPPGTGSVFGARRALAALALALAALSAPVGCGEGTRPPEPPPCDQKCQDGAALRALRETIKLAFNLTLQGKPVGAHDVTIPCVLGGSVRVRGEASSNPVQGTTEVRLTYELTNCSYRQVDSEAPENYSMAFTGSLTQEGTLAVQPTATTALLMSSVSMTFSGEVYDPPLAYEQPACPLQLVQSGGRLAGTICGREAGYEL